MILETNKECRHLYLVPSPPSHGHMTTKGMSMSTSVNIMNYEGRKRFSLGVFVFCSISAVRPTEKEQDLQIECKETAESKVQTRHRAQGGIIIITVSVVMITVSYSPSSYNCGLCNLKQLPSYSTSGHASFHLETK